MQISVRDGEDYGVSEWRRYRINLRNRTYPNPRPQLTQVVYFLIQYNILWTFFGMVRNHPSGDPTPSSADVDMTRQVVDAGRSLRIAVHDHLVVGRDGVASLKARELF